MHARLTPASNTDDIWYRVRATDLFYVDVVSGPESNYSEKMASTSEITARITRRKKVTLRGFSTLS